MKLLVIGNGGREHALVWKLAQSKDVDHIYVAPGNGGTAVEDKCQNIDIKSDDIQALLSFALEKKIDFTVVGPEIPLSEGIADLFIEAGLKIFAPVKAAAHMEASKAFAKEIMAASGVPTAKYRRFTDAELAKQWVTSQNVPIVVKADGLAAGKGVTVAQTHAEAIKAINEALVDRIFGDSGGTVVIEEFLAGEEMSYLVITDGETIIPLASAQDHKAVFDGDKGANTGGMGAYSPAPVISGEQYDKLVDLVARPIVEELKKRGISYKGILYAGLMVSTDGFGGLPNIKVLEYNCRFGDPETQVILPRMKSDLLPILMATSQGKLNECQIEWNEDPSVSVVMASGGYPGDYRKGIEINGIAEADAVEGVKVFHAGTSAKEGKIYTAGGRVLNVTAFGSTLKEAISKAYKGVACISFDEMHYRKDIGHKALKRNS
ncbi:MAG: phosphoribosylamine--glycine ligase [Deferribacteraceae bacterium]|jgi:phosphoribosylamine--glycine ligase|nr:phosphoribosylamine--glycine ligase [Deferribacteraceae bacterium]